MSGERQEAAGEEILSWPPPGSTEAIFIPGDFLRVCNATPALPLNSSDAMEVKFKAVNIMVWPQTIERLFFLNNKKRSFEKAQKHLVSSLNKQEIGDDGALTA